MKTAAAPKQHISSTPGVCGGSACIAGTRIRVQDIVIRTELAESADDIVRAYPHISLADVHAALAYYHDNRATIDQEIQDEERLIERLKREAGPGLLDQLRKGSGDAPLSS
jgi:uncharacterized protein (DUF433 family)